MKRAHLGRRGVPPLGPTLLGAGGAAYEPGEHRCTKSGERFREGELTDLWKWILLHV